MRLVLSSPQMIAFGEEFNQGFENVIQPSGVQTATFGWNFD